VKGQGRVTGAGEEEGVRGQVKGQERVKQAGGEEGVRWEVTGQRGLPAATLSMVMLRSTMLNSG